MYRARLPVSSAHDCVLACGLRRADRSRRRCTSQSDRYRQSRWLVCPWRSTSLRAAFHLCLDPPAPLAANRPPFSCRRFILAARLSHHRRPCLRVLSIIPASLIPRLRALPPGRRSSSACARVSASVLRSPRNDPPMRAAAATLLLARAFQSQ